MSGNPTTPNNVVPMPTNWPGPMFAPKTFPPGGPSCFSELAALNACYDSVQMMEQILAKVITDLVTNNKAVQAAIVEAIAASGSNVPLIGVTNGSDAQPGQVGEYVHWIPSGTYPTGTSTNVITAGTLQPGDWDLNAIIGIGGAVTSFQTQLNPQPPGVDWNMAAYVYLANPPGSGDLFILPLVQARASISVPTLFAWTQSVNAGTNPGSNYQYVISARRRR